MFNKKLVFRWDLLHLINRAHIDAKGSVKDEDEVSIFYQDDETDSTSADKGETLISELINFIQKGAKRLRHGIQFTKLQELTCGKFKRPKVWSQTRMVVYEFDMLERFF